MLMWMARTRACANTPVTLAFIHPILYVLYVRLAASRRLQESTDPFTGSYSSIPLIMRCSYFKRGFGLY